MAYFCIYSFERQSYRERNGEIERERVGNERKEERKNPSIDSLSKWLQRSEPGASLRFPV